MIRYLKNKLAKTIWFASRCVCQDHISCVFDGLPNNNALGIPVNGTADEKFERVLFCCTEAIF